MRHDEADEDDKVGGSAEDDGDSEGNDHDVDDRSAGDDGYDWHDDDEVSFIFRKILKNPKSSIIKESILTNQKVLG